MQLIVCGLGGAGSRIADALVAADSDGERSCLVDSIALDTDQRSLAALTELSEAHRHLYGTTTASGRGFGGNRTRAAETADEELTELYRAVDEVVTSQADAFVLCAGLAGATGSTLVPKLAEKLRAVYGLPIYGLGVLPAADGDNRQRAVNAGIAIDELTESTDALLVFDNALWTKQSEDESDPAIRTRLNETLASRVTTLFEAGETDQQGRVAESVVDASELINTFETGGIATLGYASQAVERPSESRFGLGLFTKETELEETTIIKAIETTVRRAVRGKLTIDVDRSSVERGLLVMGGPPEWLNRRAIADARSWLAQETGSIEIRGGDMPTPDVDEIVAIVLLTGVGNCERVEALRAAAHED